MGGEQKGKQPPIEIKVNVRMPFPQYSNARKAAADKGQSFKTWLCWVIDEALRKA